MIHLILVSALGNLFFSVIMETKNFRSALIFKVFPFFAGLGALIYYLNIVGII